MDKKFILLAFVSLLLFSGCTAMEEVIEGGSPGYNTYSSKGVSAPMMAEAVDYGGYYDYDEYSYSNQMVIKQGYATIDVESGTLEEKKNELDGILNQYHAETSSVTFNEYAAESRYAVTVKISPNQFDAFMDSLSGLGKISGVDTSFEDVTEQYTDLQTRIDNLEAELVRLNELYAQADNVEEILSIEREVTRVQTELEIYQSRALDLERRSAKSTITVYLVEQKPAVETSLILPLNEVVNLFFGALSTAILLIVLALGFIIPIAIVAAILLAIYRALGKNKKPKKG